VKETFFFLHSSHQPTKLCQNGTSLLSFFLPFMFTLLTTTTATTFAMYLPTNLIHYYYTLSLIHEQVIKEEEEAGSDTKTNLISIPHTNVN
jgi:hypothetical protein